MIKEFYFRYIPRITESREQRGIYTAIYKVTLFTVAKSWKKTLKIELPHDPAIPLLDVHRKGLDLGSQRFINSPIGTAALCTIDQLWKQAECPMTGECINEAYTHNGISFCLKKLNPAICDKIYESEGHYH